MTCLSKPLFQMNVCRNVDPSLPVVKISSLDLAAIEQVVCANGKRVRLLASRHNEGSWNSCRTLKDASCRCANNYLNADRSLCSKYFNSLMCSLGYQLYADDNGPGRRAQETRRGYVCARSRRESAVGYVMCRRGAAHSRAPLSALHS